MKNSIVLSVILLLCSCATEPQDPLAYSLLSNEKAIYRVMRPDNPKDEAYKKYELQLFYTKIDSTAGDLNFTDYTFHLNDDHYFYPASTVKFPIALFALEKLANLPTISKDTPYRINGDSLTHTIKEDIKKIFAVSDNKAYNRLYEFLGRDHINQRFRELGLTNTRIHHRLSTANAADSIHRELIFYAQSDTVRIKAKTAAKIIPLKTEKIKKGIGFMQNDSLINMPMDFSKKNYFPLEEQHNLMKRLFFPEAFSKDQQLKLTKEQRQFLMDAMRTLPYELGYDRKEYYDSYVKFFLFGDQKDDIPDHIKIYNKVGYAYGTLSETAYILDTQRNISFLLSATMLVNENRIFNDNSYEYEEIGIPFLAQLGRELYFYEVQRKRE
ncbi:serine hydrolase [Gangjinia marincola]